MTPIFLGQINKPNPHLSMSLLLCIGPEIRGPLQEAQDLMFNLTSTHFPHSLKIIMVRKAELKKTPYLKSLISTRSIKFSKVLGVLPEVHAQKAAFPHRWDHSTVQVVLCATSLEIQLFCDFDWDRIPFDTGQGKLTQMHLALRGECLSES